MQWFPWSQLQHLFSRKWPGKIWSINSDNWKCTLEKDARRRRNTKYWQTTTTSTDVTPYDSRGKQSILQSTAVLRRHPYTASPQREKMTNAGNNIFLLPKEQKKDDSDRTLEYNLNSWDILQVSIHSLTLSTEDGKIQNQSVRFS